MALVGSLLPVADIAGEMLEGPGPIAAVIVDPGVTHYPHQPRLEVGIRPIGRKSAVRLDHGLLHEVLCVDDIRRQLPGDAKKAVMQGNCFVLE